MEKSMEITINTTVCVFLTSLVGDMVVVKQTQDIY